MRHAATLPVALFLVVSPAVAPAQNVNEKDWPPVPAECKERFKGRTAAEWAVLLNDADEESSLDGMLGLQGLGGPEAFPFILRATKSHRVHVQVNAIRLLHQHKANRSTVLPVLLQAMKSPVPEVRQTAAISIGFCEYRDAVALIQKALDGETDDKTMRVMKSVIGGLNGK